MRLSRATAIGFQELTEGLLRLFFPPMCELCLCAVEEGSLCPDCESGVLAGVGISYCNRCGSSIGPHSADRQGCGRCRDFPLAFDGLVRLGPYEGSLSEACLRIKSLDGIRLARVLAQRLFDLRSEELRRLEVDGVVAIPLHWRRRWTRRYNQVDPIANVLTRSLGVPLARGLVRIRNTPAQHRLPPSDRRTNLRAAFAVRKPSRWAGKHWLLVDDVVTTGSTCQEAAAVLKRAGAARITVACIARGEGLAASRRKAPAATPGRPTANPGEVKPNGV